MNYALQSLLELQQVEEVGHVHLVWIQNDQFYLAHTDDERANGTNTEDCPIHQWLSSFEAAPVDSGVYVVYDCYDHFELEPYTWKENLRA